MAEVEGTELDESRDMLVNVDVVLRMQVPFRLGEWFEKGGETLPAWKRNPSTIKREMLRRLDVFRKQLAENGITLAFVPERVSTVPAHTMQEGFGQGLPGGEGVAVPVSSPSPVAEVDAEDEE